MQRISAGLLAAMLVLLAVPGQASTPDHYALTGLGTAHWSCPGQDIRERYVVTYHGTVFPRQTDGTHREIVHAKWRGWMRNGNTGELVHDDANWTETWTMRGNHPLRVAFSGQGWKVTIPGHGIVVQHIGRRVYEEGFDQVFASAKAKRAHTKLLCKLL
jgi:hypothetical protein